MEVDWLVVGIALEIDFLVAPKVRDTVVVGILLVTYGFIGEDRHGQQAHHANAPEEKLAIGLSSLELFGRNPQFFDFMWRTTVLITRGHVGLWVVLVGVGCSFCRC